MRNLQTVRVLLSIGLLSLPASGWAARRMGSDVPKARSPLLQRNGVKLERMRILRPSPENEVQRDFRVLEFSDGTRAVASRAVKQGSGAPRLYEQPVMWTVDLNRGTYTVKKTEPTSRDLDLMERSRQRWGAQSTRPPEGKLGAKTDGYPEEGTGPGYSYMHAAETWEPAAFFGFEPLTRTEAEIAWSECGGTSLTSRLYLDSFLPSCWANAYTLGVGATSWATVSCTPDQPWSSDQFSLSGGVAGTYINWDFGDIDEPTFAYQDVSVEAGGGGGYGWVYQYQWGEATWLLAGREFAGTTWTRPSRCPSGGGGGGGGGSTPPDDPPDPPPSEPPPGGGRPTCVPVYDGANGEFLGECCGYEVDEILECAWNL